LADIEMVMTDKEAAQEALVVAAAAQELTGGALAFAEEQRRLVAMHEINQRNLTEQLSTLVHERDALRVENEQLRAALRRYVDRFRPFCRASGQEHPTDCEVCADLRVALVALGDDL